MTADAVMSEFINQYTDEDVENVFGAHSEYDYVRKVWYVFLFSLQLTIWAISWDYDIFRPR